MATMKCGFACRLKENLGRPGSQLGKRFRVVEVFYSERFRGQDKSEEKVDRGKVDRRYFTSANQKGL